MRLSNAPLSKTISEIRRDKTNIKEYYEDLEERIENVEPDINSFVKEPDFTRIQRQIIELTEKWEHENIRPPLYGASIGIKDIFRVDGFETRAGTTLPPEIFEGPEATVVTRLRDAGAIVTGKTVSTEFAYSPTGPTRNPHDLEHTPGGSSSGSAAAVAAGLVSLALGTQTVGSIIRPAAYCGIIGFKPSGGRLPTAGVVPFSSSADQIGLFTQDLDGMKLASSVLCPKWTPSSVSETNLRVGVPSGPYLSQASETGQKAFYNQVETLGDAGIDIQEVTVFNSIDSVNELHQAMTEAEAAMAHAEWYTEYGERYHQDTADMVEAGWETSLKKVGEGRKSQRRTRNRIADIMESTDIDVLVSPAAPGPAPKGIEESGSPIMNLPWTHAGVPAITLPIDQTKKGLPLGLQCTVQHGDDERLLSIAEEVMKLFNTPI